VSWLVDRFAADMQSLLRTLDAVRPSLEFSLPSRDVDGLTPFFPNSFFGPMDAAALTAMFELLKPKRYIEIGSGMSTRFARRAVQIHRLETRILCIDPEPRSSIIKVADEVINQSMLDVDLTIFETLEKNDILFFDGSHLSFSGSDCPRFFLEILPLVRRNVYVHVHDIFLPDDYPARLRNRFYNEQQLLAAFLFSNTEFDVVLPVHHLHSLGHCPEGVSFWMKRGARSDGGG
jgi:predicted O-methyltransferase YrrM